MPDPIRVHLFGRTDDGVVLKTQQGDVLITPEEYHRLWFVLGMEMGKTRSDRDIVRTSAGHNGMWNYEPVSVRELLELELGPRIVREVSVENFGMKVRLHHCYDFYSIVDPHELLVRMMKNGWTVEDRIHSWIFSKLYRGQLAKARLWCDCRKMWRLDKVR